MERRQFLQFGAAGAFGSAAVGPHLASRDVPTFVPLTKPAGPRPDPKKKIGSDLIPQVKNIVVVMMENQSYDAVLGMLTKPGTSKPRGDGLTWKGSPSSRALNTNPTTLAAHSPRLQSYPMPTTAQMDDYPWQTWDATFTQFLGSPTAQKLPSSITQANQGFVVSQSGPIAMGYFTPSQLPFINSMAQTFPVADRWFSSVPGQTYPNRMFMMAGTSLGLTTTTLPDVETMPENGTIFQALLRYGISWKNYHCGDVFGASSLIWIGQLLGSKASMWFGNRLAPMNQFYADCATGSLPAVSLVDPNFGFSSGENSQDLQHADAFLHDVINAVMSGPGWKDTMVVWTFDEGGGYYDHVPPVKLGRPDNSVPTSQMWAGNPALASFDWSGMRVPSGVVSPYAKPNYVSSQVYDHTSILKLIRQKWNLPAFTSRDAKANSPLDMLDLHAKPAFLHPPTLAPKVRDRAGAVVSTGVGSDTAPTADELAYPDDGTHVPGSGRLWRRQFFADNDGNPTTAITPYWRAIQKAMGTQS
ncbi:MAG: alkaline phosphatase family protein [Actinomycetota bacterium]